MVLLTVHLKRSTPTYGQNEMCSTLDIASLERIVIGLTTITVWGRQHRQLQINYGEILYHSLQLI